MNHFDFTFYQTILKKFWREHVRQTPLRVPSSHRSVGTIPTPGQPPKQAQAFARVTEGGATDLRFCLAESKNKNNREDGTPHCMYIHIYIHMCVCVYKCMYIIDISIYVVTNQWTIHALNLSTNRSFWDTSTKLFSIRESTKPWSRSHGLRQGTIGKRLIFLKNPRKLETPYL